MQTFLPFRSFAQSAKVLDRMRLGKQRVENLQIIQCLTANGSLRWKNHPAVRMWEGFLPKLMDYQAAICLEWRDRGYKDTCLSKSRRMVIEFCDPPNDYPLGALEFIPPWLGDERLHASHRSNLLRKDREHYGQFGWTEPDDMPYYWPSHEEK